MRQELELIYIDYEVNKYNSQYTTVFFEDIDRNRYLWNVTGNTKAFTEDFNFRKGDTVKLAANIEGRELKRVKILIA